MKRIKPFVSRSTLLSIYNALVQSHFAYCDLIWDNCVKTLLGRQQKLQNRDAHVLASSSYDVEANLDGKICTPKIKFRKL